MTLQPGDLILTGTPDGVVDCRHGDVIVTCDRRHRRPDQHHPGSAMQIRPPHQRQGGRPDRLFRDRQPGHAGGAGRSGRGGEAEVNAAVAAAKAAFPAWAGTPGHRARRLIRKLGDLIAKHVPEIAQHRNQGHRPGDRPDRQAAGAARGRQLLLLRRDVHAGGRPHLPHAHAPELHAVPPGGRVRADQPLERALHDGHLEGRALPGFSATPRC
jgi:hypothetical protein